MNKLAFIGIDSMDHRLVHQYLDELPNFKEIINNSPNLNFRSVFPPDSDTAWASIYTGKNPAKHGIVNFVDPLEKASIYQTDYLDISNVRGNTFWDIAGREGNKVCLIFPHIAYPVWKVNGFIISPVPKTDEFQMFPPDFKFDFEIDKLEVPKRIPNSKDEYEDYINKFEKIVRNEFDFAQKMLLNYKWDFYLFYSCVLDYIQHIFWNYCDPYDPTYPGDNNPFKDVIKKFYILHDQLIGELIKRIDSNIPIMVVSDHGHSMRPINLFNINEVLRKEGFLFSKDSLVSPLYGINEKIKRIAVETLQKTDFRKTALNLLRKYPKIKEIYTVPSSIDFEKTKAHCTDLSGMKSYTYGGVILSDNIDDKDEKEQITNNIIEILENYRDPDNKRLFEWICKREDLYEGPFINKYPEIIFNLNENYGAGWAVNVDEFSKTTAHNFFPGSHYGDAPVFYLNNFGNRDIIKNDVTLMDIAPTILDILGIKWHDYDFDGKSIFK